MVVEQRYQKGILPISWFFFHNDKTYGKALLSRILLSKTGRLVFRRPAFLRSFFFRADLQLSYAVLKVLAAEAQSLCTLGDISPVSF